jgi:hypothetical protein
VDARKTRYSKADLRKVFKDATRVVTARGKKSVEFDLKKGFPPLDELAKVALGPSGNLRAPAARMGKTWLVGFGEEAWSGHFD